MAIKAGRSHTDRWGGGETPGRDPSGRRATVPRQGSRATSPGPRPPRVRQAAATVSLGAQRGCRRGNGDALEACSGPVHYRTAARNRRTNCPWAADCRGLGSSRRVLRCQQRYRGHEWGCIDRHRGRATGRRAAAGPARSPFRPAGNDAESGCCRETARLVSVQDAAHRGRRGRRVGHGSQGPA